MGGYYTLPQECRHGSGRWGAESSPSPDGRLLDRDGRPTEGLWAIGPLRRGAPFETTAIPEIRQQAAALAECLPEAAMAAELGHALEEAL